jgi:hypothetical protein
MKTVWVYIDTARFSPTWKPPKSGSRKTTLKASRLRMRLKANQSHFFARLSCFAACWKSQRLIFRCSRAIRIRIRSMGILPFNFRSSAGFG